MSKVLEDFFLTFASTTPKTDNQPSEDVVFNEIQFVKSDGQLGWRGYNHDIIEYILNIVSIYLNSQIILNRRILDEGFIFRKSFIDKVFSNIL